MELDDPLIQSVLIYMNRHPGGIDLEEFVGSDQVDEVMECLVRNGLVKRVRIGFGGSLPQVYQIAKPNLLNSASASDLIGYLSSIASYLSASFPPPGPNPRFTWHIWVYSA